MSRVQKNEVQNQFIKSNQPFGQQVNNNLFRYHLSSLNKKINISPTKPTKITSF